MRAGELACLAFTERGYALARRICAALGGEAQCTRDGADLRGWTEKQFSTARALVYVGAAGIAVRAVAPHLVSKASDPAVVCVDELGRYAIPLASGHLGGANALAREIAALLGAEAVITTATDVNGVFAADEWARVQGLLVAEPEKIKTVSARALAGETLTVCSAFPVDGEPPEGVRLASSGTPDVWVDVYRHPCLCLVPTALTLGVGCVRGTTRETLNAQFEALCAEYGLWRQAVCAVASIDRKADEPGLLDFCAAYDWTLTTYTAEELAAVEGDFSGSAFVAAQVGVDNVCERAAVRAARGPLLVRKFAGHGVTLALARRPLRLDWRRRDA